MKATPRHFKEMAKTFDKDFYYVNAEWRDKKRLDIALELYYNIENPDDDTFDNCIDEAGELMRKFYNARYNQDTRRR